LETILKTNGLTKKYNKRAVVDHVSVNVRRGDIYGLIGKNGAGKTTFMRLVLGFAVPNEGTVELFGGEPHKTAGQKIGSLIEAPAFYGGCTAIENLRYFSMLSGRGTNTEIPDERLHALIDMVGLSDAAKKKVGNYSLGMKQRLGLAIAMIGDPEFLILDEPVNGLDPAGIRDVRDTIRRLNHETGVTILISSHLLDELSKVATKYGILNDGKLVEEITTEELEERCRHNVTMIVDDPVRARQLLSEMIPQEDLSVEQHKLTVYAHTDQAAAFNRKLVTSGIDVYELTTHTRGVEDFFIERIGG
jgi:ABC-2 type transport system ATP-binding protein